jgi:hypothetical protein
MTMEPMELQQSMAAILGRIVSFRSLSVLFDLFLLFSCCIARWFVWRINGLFIAEISSKLCLLSWLAIKTILLFCGKANQALPFLKHSPGVFICHILMPGLYPGRHYLFFLAGADCDGWRSRCWAPPRVV